MNTRPPKKTIHLPPLYGEKHQNKTNSDIVLFNRLTLNKMLLDKTTRSVDSYAWLSEKINKINYSVLKYLKSYYLLKIDNFVIDYQIIYY